MRQTSDIVIAGGGFAGLGLAIALKAHLGMHFSVAVVDPGLGKGPAQDERASAIAAAARRFFENLGVWDAVAPQAEAIVEMVVTDSSLADPLRPRFLGFEGDVQPGEPFAHMIGNAVLLDALAARAAALGVELIGSGETVRGYALHDAGLTVTLASGRSLDARLLVAADGARSRLREQAGIAMHGWDYDQTGIVTTVAHERPHGGRAEEHFLPGGPFAALPLPGNRSSIVWTERRAEAQRIMALDDAAFRDELERRFGLALGEIEVVGRRAAFPLAMRIARSFVADRLALVGDAAHVIHPIAGQGLNLGIRDVAALAECIIDTAELGLDIGGPAPLERYQRWRRFDTVAMGVATDALNRLFSNDVGPLRLLRDVGLGIVDRLPPAKRLFIREAAGVTGTTPRLMRRADAA